MEDDFKYESQTDKIVRELLAENKNKELTEFVQAVYDYCKYYKDNNSFEIKKFILYANPRSEKYLAEQFSIEKKLNHSKKIGEVKLDFYTYSTRIKDINIELLFSALIPKGTIRIFPILNDIDYITAYPIFPRGGLT